MPLQFTLSELAAKTAATLVGNPQFIVSGVNTLDEAKEQDVSFLANPKYLQTMQQSSAGVICIHPDTPKTEGKNYLISNDPSRLFQIIVELFFPTSTSGFSAIHPTAVIHPSAKIGNHVSIGPYAVIDAHVEIQDGASIASHVTISHHVKIGSDSIIHANVVVREKCIIGHRVIIQPGAVIGSCGFGYTTDAIGKHNKLQQLGIVIVEDDVEIGANTTIDRSRFKATIIRKGSKIDNLCQIAHNVEIGEDNIIAAQTGIAGSAKTGKHVIMGGQVGVVGHIEIDSQVMVASRSGVSKNLKSGKYRGSPAVPIEKYSRQEVYIRKLESYAEKLKNLEKEIEKIHSQISACKE